MSTTAREKLLELEQALERESAARREAELQLEQKCLELQQRNEQLMAEVRKHELTEANLQAHAEALAVSNRDLEEFAYAASHDLQAPLRSITGFSQLLMKHSAGKLDARCDEYLEYIESSARHLHLLIHDLLEYSRVGRIEARLEWVDAGEAVRQATRRMGRVVEERHAAILHSRLPKVYADSRLLVQLFQHLVGNAIKYSRDGISPEVRITGERRDRGWEFAVKDNGIGMDSAETGRIFTIFQRLHTQEKYEGTGIGLSICKKIVERHGGRIWAESQPGQGSTFRFTLIAPAGAPAG